jgi:mRNA interferase MazF
VVVVQGDTFGDTPHRIVALCNTATGQARSIRPRITPDAENALEAVSDVAVDILVTVEHDKFGKAIGRLSDGDLARVDYALLLILGFA